MMSGILFLLAQAAAPAAPAKPATLQQRFDTAMAAALDGRCAEALPLLTGLEAEPKLRRNARATAAIAVRKGMCMMSDTALSAAETSIRQGLPELEAAGDEFAVDIARAHLSLGSAARARFDYAGAADEYRLALARSAGAARVRPLLALSQVLMFDEGSAAIDLATEALRIATENKFEKEQLAAVRTQYARALLNGGRTKEAYDQLKVSLREQGGLGTRVGLSDIVTRSDLAVAASLAGDMDGARQYLAYSGAGRTRDTPFVRAQNMDMPLCGVDTGLKPQDVAVVQFSIETDGHVSGATSIYTPGGREAAIAFARAVAGWSWEPAQVASIPLIFRYATRVELRCTRSGERASLTGSLEEAVTDWLDANGAGTPAWRGQSDALAAPMQRTALTQATAAGNNAAALGALIGLVQNVSVPSKDKRGYLAQAFSLGGGVPVRAFIAIRLAQAQADNPRDEKVRLRKLAAEPMYAGDPLVAGTLALLIARPGDRTADASDTGALLDRVIESDALPAKHPVRTAAILQRANLLAAGGDVARAQAMFERSGLTEEQCALIQPTPEFQRLRSGSYDYPIDAVQMGFEGWVQTEFDIAADGTTIEPRTIAAYPPFLFNKAAQEMSRRARFSSSYRPAGSLACSANRLPIRFSLPKM